ncbi:MAG TPA: cysteine-rich CWC family protein [Oxalicibacterium sp.]|uniref:cysteine-rich CWC family protein n=1 Tax=Oxalicibacterium sp. TaxID=2766525 RepID=UPI002C5093E8|nr:cysteine-rich CWC family protein [Oxalicibacterium sp.]HWU99366.1 cysteine-rich CWC family protein [Oxalicibacterium sp.]
MSRCAQCSAEFLCGVADGNKMGEAEQCWCMALPRLPSTGSLLRDSEGNAKTCLCPGCLRALRMQRMTAG